MSVRSGREIVVDEHQSTDDQLLAARVSLYEIDGMRGSDASCRTPRANAVPSMFLALQQHRCDPLDGPSLKRLVLLPHFSKEPNQPAQLIGTAEPAELRVGDGVLDVIRVAPLAKFHQINSEQFQMRANETDLDQPPRIVHRLNPHASLVFPLVVAMRGVPPLQPQE
jgi:hypothetical protein